MSVTRYVTLVSAEAHATLTSPSHRVTDRITSTLAVTGAVLAVAASSARCVQTPA